MSIEKPEDIIESDDYVKSIADPMIEAAFYRLLEKLKDHHEYFSQSIDGFPTSYTLDFPTDKPAVGQSLRVIGVNGREVILGWQ